MLRSGIVLLATGFVLLLASCSAPLDRQGTPPATDPFAGFFAHPSSGKLELRRAGEDTYRGSLWADFGPFPVEGRREGNVIHGTVTYGGVAHPLVIRHAAEGLVVTLGGTRAEAPLRRYRNREAYEKWFAAQGGYQGEIVPDPIAEPQE